MVSRITRVAIRDYRSIASCDVELQPLTLLVGPNGSGKSNFLDALRFLADSMRAPLEEVVLRRYGIRSILRRLPSGGMASSFSIQVSFELEDARVGTYSVTVSAGNDDAAVIDEERCEVGDDHFKSTRGNIEHTASAAPASTGDRPALVSFGSLPEFAPVFNLVAGMTFYSPRPERMRPPIVIGPGTALAAEASNAADVVACLIRTRPDTIGRIREYLSAFNPEFAGLTTVENGGYRWLTVTASNSSKWRFYSSDVSDGTLRAIAILLAVFQAGTVIPRISLVGLEEPESNLHPAAAGILLDALLEASASVPILASTHSADLFDRKDLPENAILAVALHDGETVIGPISDSEKSILRRRLYTAGELLRSNQLTPAAASSSK